MTSKAKPPPFLMGATLLFWGWQAELLPVAAAMAFVLEMARYTTIRWEVTDEDFSRIWTLCTVVFLACALYAFTANEGPNGFRGFFQNPTPHTTREAGNASARTAASLIRWQPMIFFLFVVAQGYSIRQGVPLETISLIMGIRWRRAQRPGKPPTPKRVHDVSYVYFGLCLFSASIHPGGNTSYFWGICALVVWALWGLRSPRFNLGWWGASVAVAVALGYGGQSGVGYLQRYIENLNPQWFSRYTGAAMDADRSRTSLGRIGRLKGSASIAVRLETHPGNAVPAYLREASYRSFKTHTWFSGGARGPREPGEEGGREEGEHGRSGAHRSPGRREGGESRGADQTNRLAFENVSEDTNKNTWVLEPGKPTPAAVTMGCYLPGGLALLPLPSGVGRLEKLSAYTIQKNPLGAVLAEGPRVVVFDALYGPGSTIDSPAELPEDLYVPENEKPALDKIIEETGLRGKDRATILRRLDAFVSEKFTYSMWQTERWSREAETPVTRFLLDRRAGHCEYFATATVLLLRRLDIPARYAVGYSVHEKLSERKFVVRQRDAHAWCLVWNQEKKLWQDFDTTPGIWVRTEMARASMFQPVSDLWQDLMFQLGKVRWGQTNLRRYLLIGSLPIITIFFIQVVFRRRKRHKTAKPGQGEVSLWPGLDSEFYLLEKSLARAAVPRAPGETFNAWLARCAQTPDLAPLRQPLHNALRLHYKYRFDPQGITAGDREELRHQTRFCIAEMSRAAVASPRNN